MELESLLDEDGERHLATSLGLGSGFGLARVAATSLGGETYMDTGAPSYGLITGVIAWVIAGAVVGMAHWLVLHQNFERAGWWALAVVLVFAASAGWGGSGSGRVTMPWIPGGVIYGAVLGLVSALPLILVLRRRATH